MTLLAQFNIVGQLLRIRRVDHHDLALLAMWSGSTVQKHGVGTSNRHVEGSNICLAVLEGNVTAVDTAFHGRACCIGRRLRDGVVAVGKLELDDIADCCSNGVGDEGILWATDDYGNDLVCATKRVGVFGQYSPSEEMEDDIHLTLGSLLTVLNAGPGSALAVATRAREKMVDFIV